MGAAAHGLDTMRATDPTARSRASVSSHSLFTVLLVALGVSLAPLAVTALVSATGLTAAFLAGALSGTAVAVARRGRQRRTERRQSAGLGAGH